ncbi:hypothetical protein I4U23_021846 [Adineta vaga]|nr:hypothetical protein I4U23_021846 [Adineta vaga]
MRSTAIRSAAKKNVKITLSAASQFCLPLLPPTISISDRTHAPASFAQQRIWLNEQIHFNQSASTSVALYNITVPLYIKDGTMSIERIRTALMTVVERNHVLRTAVYFDYDKNQIVQEVMPITNERISFCVTHNVQSDVQFDALLVAETNTPFARLDQGLVVRCHLIQMNNKSKHDKYLHKGDIILFAFHHIAFDLISAGHFIIAFGEAYDEPTKVDHKNTLQYIDFTLYELNQLNSSSTIMNETRQFWSTIMNGYQWNDDYSFSFLSQAANKLIVARSGLGHSVKFELDQDIVEEQMRFALVSNISMFQLGVACYFIFLYTLNYSEFNDLCILIPTSSRSLIELKSIIGMFVNLIPYRLKINQENTFPDLIEKVCNLCLKVLEYSHLPYQHIIDYTLDKRPPTIQISFQYESHLSNLSYKSEIDMKMKDVQLGGSKNRYLTHDNGVSLFDLSLTLCHNHQKQTTEGFLECSVDLIDKNTISILTKRFQCLLRHIFTRKTAYDRKDESVSLLRWLLNEEVNEIQMDMFQQMPPINNQG